MLCVSLHCEIPVGLQDYKEYNNSPSNRSIVNFIVKVSKKMTFKVYILDAKVVIIYYTNKY